MLKASARNCTLHLSLMLTFLNREVSKVVRLGPVRDPRPTFPKVPLTGGADPKAFGSNHRFGLPRITGPVKAGFQFGTSGLSVSPVPEVFAPTCGVKGKPLCAVTMPFHCQPPISFSRRPLEPPPQRRPSQM